MSEYQYYEFVAVDQPLDPSQQAELRAISTRAEITPSRFVNRYNWGDLQGDPAQLVERYFDAFLYLANWGTRRLRLRLPRRLLDTVAAERYCCGEAAAVQVAGSRLILDFTSRDEDGEWDGEGDGWLASIIPVRADLAAGDLRALYVAWLLLVESGEVDDDELEPPVPPNLGRLTTSLQSLAEFLRVDPDLLAAAAEASPDVPLPGELPDGDLTAWIAGLPPGDRDAMLLRACRGEGALLGAELLGRFRRDLPPPAEAAPPRSVRDLLAATRVRRAERRRRIAQEEARERARREREAALARERRLAALAPREAAAWGEVEAHVASTRQSEYDDALRLLADLRVLAERAGRLAEFETRLLGIRRVHARKHTFIERLDRARLGGG